MPATIRSILHVAVLSHWPVYQLDVKNVFHHGELIERVYCHQPVDFVDPEHPDHVCLLVKSLYHFKQVSQA